MRTRARELALKGLYAFECGETDAKDDFSNIVTGESLPPATFEYARRLFRLTREHQAWADTQINDLSQNWDLKRMATLDLIILRLALVELSKMPDVPVKVVINEAIELARTYSTIDSGSFINGILDAFIHKKPKTAP